MTLDYWQGQVIAAQRTRRLEVSDRGRRMSQPSHSQDREEVNKHAGCLLHQPDREDGYFIQYNQSVQIATPEKSGLNKHLPAPRVERNTAIMATTPISDSVSFASKETSDGLAAIRAGKCM
jgi:hypothetical protein